MTPSRARRRIRALRIAATLLVLYAFPTLVFSLLKAFYLATAAARNVFLIGLLPVAIEAIYNDLIQRSPTLQYWWGTARVPDPHDLSSIDNLYVLGHVALLVLAAFMYRHAAKIARMLRNAKRRRQEREWENHPDG